MKNLLILFLIHLITFSKCLALDFIKVDKGIYVHFGKQEDSNTQNFGDIANIGFIIGKNLLQ